MKKMSYAELKQRFCNHEDSNPEQHLIGYIVFSSSNWPDKDYGLESRTYSVSSDDKAFKPNMCGYSIFGYSLDGTDMGVRLDRHMRDEKGGASGWVVDYCYMEDNNNEND